MPRSRSKSPPRVTKKECEEKGMIAVNRNGKIHCRRRPGPRSRHQQSPPKRGSKKRAEMKSPSSSDDEEFKDRYYRGHNLDKMTGDEIIDSLTVAELKVYARSRGLAGISALKKKELKAYIRRYINVDTGEVRRSAPRSRDFVDSD